MSSANGARDSEVAPPDIVRARYDWTTTPPSYAIVETITKLVDAVPCSLFSGQEKTLQDYVDLGALDLLLDDERTNITQITFTIESYTVLLHKDGLVVAGVKNLSL